MLWSVALLTVFLRVFSRFRLDFPSFRKAKNWNKDYPIKKHQYVALYIIVNYCRNSEGAVMSSKDYQTIAQKCVFDDQKGETPIIDWFSDPDHAASVLMAAFIEKDKENFINNTRTLIKRRESSLIPDNIQWRIDE